MKRRNFLVQSMSATAFAIGKPGLPAPGFEIASSTVIRECKLHGLSVLVWGVLKKEDMIKMINLGVDSIMADDIALLNTVLIKN